MNTYGMVCNIAANERNLHNQQEREVQKCRSRERSHISRHLFLADCIHIQMRLLAVLVEMSKGGGHYYLFN